MELPNFFSFKSLSMLFKILLVDESIVLLTNNEKKLIFKKLLITESEKTNHSIFRILTLKSSHKSIKQDKLVWNIGSHLVKINPNRMIPYSGITSCTSSFLADYEPLT